MGHDLNGAARITEEAKRCRAIVVRKQIAAVGLGVPRRILAALDPRGRFGFVLLALAGAGLVALYCEMLRQSRLGDPAVVVALAIFLAALTSGIAGFAFSAICGALLFHIMHGPVEIVRLMMACSVANQVMGVWAVRHAVHWPSLKPFLLGGLIGVPIGVFLLTHANPGLYERVIGVLLVGYCTWMLFRKPVVVRHTSTLGDLLVGSVAGLAGGGVAGLAGVPAATRVSMKGWDKDRQRGLFQPLILTLQILALAWSREVVLFGCMVQGSDHRRCSICRVRCSVPGGA